MGQGFLEVRQRQQKEDTRELRRGQNKGQQIPLLVEGA
jgi:hypothetical protein